MLIVSRVMGSRLRIVILTVRRAVFIFTSTLRMVPCTTVPGDSVSFLSHKALRSSLNPG